MFECAKRTNLEIVKRLIAISDLVIDNLSSQGLDRLMKIIYRGKLKNVEFTFALGDLFDAQVEAIVSSEQTDFVLSRNRDSISGQIWHRYGDPIQQELDEATKGQVLHPGTVLDTT